MAVDLCVIHAFVASFALMSGNFAPPRVWFCLGAAASQSLGPQWKKGFLDGGAKRPARAPSAAKHGAQVTKQAAGASAVVVPKNDETAKPKAESSAFRQTVVEKPHGPGGASSALEEKAPVAPARISRFKARRQGL